PSGTQRTEGEVVLALEDARITDTSSGREIVHGVSFALRRGRVLGIVGESGSGKTLTCRALLGILPRLFALSGGAVKLKGRDTAQLSARDWKELHGSVISAVFQDPASYLNPSLRVGKQLE